MNGGQTVFWFTKSCKINTSNRKRGSGTQVCACPFISPFSLQGDMSPHPLVCQPNLTPIGSLSQIVICWIHCLVPGCNFNCPQYDSDPEKESFAWAPQICLPTVTRDALSDVCFHPDVDTDFCSEILLQVSRCAGCRWGTGQQWKWWDFWPTFFSFFFSISSSLLNNRTYLSWPCFVIGHYPSRTTCEVCNVWFMTQYSVDWLDFPNCLFCLKGAVCAKLCQWEFVWQSSLNSADGSDLRSRRQ